MNRLLLGELPPFETLTATLSLCVLARVCVFKHFGESLLLQVSQMLLWLLHLFDVIAHETLDHVKTGLCGFTEEPKLFNFF